MKLPAIEGTSAAKAGGVVVIVLLAWVAFFLFPFPRAHVAPRAQADTHPVSGFGPAGLRDNPDWDGLPQLFALWSDHAEWRDDRTRFAYWHPVAKEYAYHFEARRVAGAYTFREIPPPGAGYRLGDTLAEDCPIRFYFLAPDAVEPDAAAVSVDGPALPAVIKRPAIPAATVELPGAGSTLKPAEPTR